MATKKNELTLKRSEIKKNVQSFCEQAAMAAEYKREADKLRPFAAEELQSKLDSNPDTKDFKGTVVYICGDKIYKIRVQRPASCNWMSKHLNDPILKKYKDLMKEIEKKTKEAEEYEAELAKAHPKCLEYKFVIAYMSK
ncbi:MAG: hypothetical protein J5808_07240 [Paludibacteraceae bacterium]|nr:hypothetical protein [Paludibacteraceae bacterium]